MNLLNLFKKKREPKIIGTHIIDGDGFVTTDFKYPYKIILFVYADGRTKKRFIEKWMFSESDSHLVYSKETELWDYVTVTCVLEEAMKRCGITEYNYGYDEEIMNHAKCVVRELKAHHVSFRYCEGEEYDFRCEHKMKEVQFLRYAKFLNAENTN